MKKSINPYNGEMLFQFKELSDKELQGKIEAADKAFQSWKKTGFEERAKLMSKAANELKANKHEYAKVMTQEMGKPISQSVAEVEKCAWVCEYYAENAEEQLKDEIIETDADMEQTVETCVKARFQNTGQSCIAGKRLLVHADIAKDFMEKFTTRVRELKSGDTMDVNTYIGVLAREDLAKDMEKQVNDSIKMGAKLELGGKRDGNYFEPTLLSGVTPKMPMFKEETFGPAIGITTFKTDEEAVKLSNDSVFGLGVSIFTTDTEKAKKLAPQFDEGAVFVNELVKSDPRLPFGGVKISGYGRELSSHGIKEFMNKKTIYINQ